MTIASFYSGSDWEGSSGPILSRQVSLNDVWPEGNNIETLGGDKDILADGLHPVLAIGPKASRPQNLIGVVLSYNASANLVQMNIAEGVIIKQYVANILTYANGVAATFDQSMAVGEPVYIDDSEDLDPGVTLSRSPLNDQGSTNPKAGYLFYCQDEYQDYGVGGPNTSAVWPKALDNAISQAVYCVLLVQDSN